jgi:mRNA interferase RelE/StbE
MKQVVRTGRLSRKNSLAYKIEIRPGAQKQIQDLPRPAQLKIVDAIDRLTENPRPSGCKKLKGAEIWRIRIGRFRIIYSIIDKKLLIILLKVARRQEDTYKNF